MFSRKTIQLLGGDHFDPHPYGCNCMGNMRQRHAKTSIPMNWQRSVNNIHTLWRFPSGHVSTPADSSKNRNRATQHAMALTALPNMGPMHGMQSVATWGGQLSLATWSTRREGGPYFIWLVVDLPL